MLRFFILLLLISVAACSGAAAVPVAPTPVATPSPAPAPVPAGPPTVTITAAGMNPLEITIAAGQTVTFVNNDARPHEVTGGKDPDNPDSYGGRLSWADGPWSIQLSGADLKTPERASAYDARRVTASIAYFKGDENRSIAWLAAESYGSPLSFHIFARYRGRAGVRGSHVH